MPALYRKYRPQTFAEVIGQEPIIEVLSAAIAKNKVAHGYLFAGPRGSGKTTTARLLAKAVNCPEKNPPCNKCAICLDVIAGRDFDVIEIDAASHRGIEEMRELRDKVRFPPNRAKYKVYIVDEVHMLTKEAFNALLKTLEEPPAHVIFIFATTESHKVPATIVSRVQRFDFRRATSEQIKHLLLKVAKSEKITLDEDAAEQIAYFSDGSFRDGLALLDQVSAGGTSAVSKTAVLRVFGVSSMEPVEHFITALLEKNPTKAITIVNELYGQGIDLGAFLTLVIGKLRHIMLEEARLELAGAIEQFLGAAANLKYAPIAQIPIELAVVKITGLPAEVSTKAGLVAEDVSGPGEPITDGKWQEFISGLKPHNHSLAALLSSCVGEVAGGHATIYVRFKFHRDKILEPANSEIIKQAFLQTFGKAYTLVCSINSAKVEERQQQLDQEIIDTALEVFEASS